MDIETILSPERTCCSLTAASKKRAFEEIASHIASTFGDDQPGAAQIYEKLITREKMGTTAIGHGIAIPHCRLESCTQIIGALFRLESPVDFGAYDEEPVRLIFVLLVPAEEVEDHLTTLSMLAGRFESEAYRTALLEADDDADLYSRAIAEPPLANSA